jgi:hypothetical protein
VRFGFRSAREAGPSGPAQTGASAELSTRRFVSVSLLHRPEKFHHYCYHKAMPTEKELIERIRQLEEQNSSLQDKLDMIYAILAPDYEEAEEAEADDMSGDGFVQIDGFGTQKKFD